jgi:hypothetical protein
MSIVTIQCPRLGKLVSTGVEAEPDEFHRLGPKIFRMRCSACGSEHLWSRGTAWLSEATAKPSVSTFPPLDGGKENGGGTQGEPGMAEPVGKRDYIAGIIDRFLGASQQ